MRQNRGDYFENAFSIPFQLILNGNQDENVQIDVGGIPLARKSLFQITYRSWLTLFGIICLQMRFLYSVIKIHTPLDNDLLVAHGRADIDFQSSN